MYTHTYIYICICIYMYTYIWGYQKVCLRNSEIKLLTKSGCAVSLSSLFRSRTLSFSLSPSPSHACVYFSLPRLNH